MNILILNWRDIKNPAGGGAEILTHEMALRWVKAGHKVHQFSSAFAGSKSEETVDGVIFIRRGRWWTVHVLAIFYYFQHRKDIDVIIDEVHWFPFFAAVYAPHKTVALTCEIASKLLFRIFPYPVAAVFLLIEKLYLLLYRNVPTMVISPSTKDDLLATGHSKENIVVLPMGITIPKNIKVYSKERTPTLISVGRLNKQKGTNDVVEAFRLISKAIPESQLWLVGSGERIFIKSLEKKIKDYGLTKKIELYGFVTEKEKFSLMSKAHVLISASAQEGWGLTIPEAGLMKTPSVVYNIQGFRDIIVQNKTGILVDKSPDSLAQSTIKLLSDKRSYKRMQENIYKSSTLFSWDTTADFSLQFIKNSFPSISKKKYTNK